MNATPCASDCLCHVNPFDYVPCCPLHLRPLRAAEAGHGQCSWSRQGTEIGHAGGLERVTRRCTTYGPSEWLWLPRDRFDYRDLPPHNGEEPPRTPPVGSPWDVIFTLCGRCTSVERHVEGQNRRVCTVCGTAAWVPSPQYAADFKDVV